jgi:hypothetical protein
MDSYTATEAARILGVSARRIRQLAQEKRLKITQKKPLRVSAVDVVAMKKKRESEGVFPVAQKQATESALLRQSLDTLSNAVELMQRQITAGEEASRRNEDTLREQLALERASRERLEKELSELRNRKRGLFSR